jgi:integrase
VSRTIGTKQSATPTATRRPFQAPDRPGNALARKLCRFTRRRTHESVHPRTDQCGPWLIERAIRDVRDQIDGLPEGFSFHDLRHYLASLLIASGADIKTVQARMRHASARTTLDTYGHLWPDADESTRTAVGAVIAERLKTSAYPLRTESPSS